MCTCGGWRGALQHLVSNLSHLHKCLHGARAGKKHFRVTHCQNHWPVGYWRSTCRSTSSWYRTGSLPIPVSSMQTHWACTYDKIGCTKSVTTTSGRRMNGFVIGDMPSGTRVDVERGDMERPLFITKTINSRKTIFIIDRLNFAWGWHTVTKRDVYATRLTWKVLGRPIWTC